MSKIVEIPTVANLTPDKILEAAKGKLSECIVIGYEKETDEIYFAGSIAEIPEVNYLLDKAKAGILE